MGKDTSNSPDKSGTPASLLVSIVCTIIVFAMAEIQNSFELGDSFAMRYVLMAYVGLGLALAFFWKRLERSPFLKISSGFYLFGLWVSLFMTTLAPVLLKGESPYVHGQVMQQFGLGFVAFSGFMLVVALLQNQKMVPGLLFSALGAVALLVTGGAGFFLKAHHDGEGSIASHAGKGHDDKHGEDEGEEISAHGKTMAAKAHAADGAEDGDEHASEEAEDEPGDGTKSLDQVIEEMEHGGSEKEAAHEEKSHGKKAAKHDEHAAPAGHGDHHEAAQKSPAHVKPAAVKEAKAKKSNVASLENAVEVKKEVSEGHGKGPHWSYEAGADSPEHWGSIADEFRKCSVGQSQSPIDVPSAWPTMNDVVLDYKLTPVSIADNGHTIEFKVGEQNFARIAGKKYKLIQFHIHTPSEHWIDGRSSPMEVHFVHKDEKNNLAVLAVMIDQGAESKVFGEMWGYVPQGINLPARPRDKLFNIATLVPAKLKVYRYRGSLTTPPCSENVLWSVASDKMTFSKEQIDAFRVRYKNNARPIQKRSTTAH